MPRPEEKDADLEQEGGRKKSSRRRACKFCTDENLVIDYKNAGLPSTSSLTGESWCRVA